MKKHHRVKIYQARNVDSANGETTNIGWIVMTRNPSDSERIEMKTAHQGSLYYGDVKRLHELFTEVLEDWNV